MTHRFWLVQMARDLLNHTCRNVLLIEHWIQNNQRFVFQAEKISTILKAADVKVEPYWPGLFAKALEGVDAKALISNVGAGAGAAPAAGAPAAASAGKICLQLFSVNNYCSDDNKDGSLKLH